MDQFDAGAGQETFGRHVLELAPGILQDRDFDLVGRRKRHMTTFAGQCRPACPCRDQARHAEAGAGAEQSQRSTSTRYAPADLDLVAVPQVRQRARQCIEIVDHQQRLEAQFLAQRLDRELPVVIRHADLVAVDRVGDRHGRMPYLPCRDDRRRSQVGANGVGQRGMVATAQHLHLLEPPRRQLQREACVGAADVGKQARRVEGTGGGNDGCGQRSSHCGTRGSGCPSLLDFFTDLQEDFVV